MQVCEVDVDVETPYRGNGFGYAEHEADPLQLWWTLAGGVLIVGWRSVRCRCPGPQGIDIPQPLTSVIIYTRMNRLCGKELTVIGNWEVRIAWLH